VQTSLVVLFNTALDLRSVIARHPRRPTPYPYATLFRSPDGLRRGSVPPGGPGGGGGVRPRPTGGAAPRAVTSGVSRPGAEDRPGPRHAHPFLGLADPSTHLRPSQAAGPFRLAPAGRRRCRRPGPAGR